MTPKQIHELRQEVLTVQHTLRGLTTKLDKALASLGVMDNEQLSLATGALRKGRDRNKWLYNHEWYGKGQLPLAVFQEQIDGNYTLQELRDLFAPEKLFPNYVRGNKIVFKPVTEIREQENSRYHSYIIHTKDTPSVELRVSNQWGTNNFFELLDYLSKTFNFPVQAWEA